MLLMLLQERELGDLLSEIAHKIFGNLGQIAALLFIFGLPLLESLRRKARERQQSGAQRPAPRSVRPPPPNPAQEQAGREAHGREVWEALLRGERPPEPPELPELARAPAPAPSAPVSPRRPAPSEAQVPALLRPAPMAATPFQVLDEEALAQAVLERDLARGRSFGDEPPPLPHVAAAAPSVRLAVRAPRSVRELVLASEMMAPPVALRALDGGGSLPPGLAAW